MKTLDATDRQLIALLQDNARLSTVALARAVGLSRSTVQERLQRLDFSTRPTHVESFLSEVNALGHVQEVMHESLEQRTVALEAARRKLAHLVQIGIRLGRERDHETLLRDVLHGARDIAQCTVARLHVRTDHHTLRMALCTSTGDRQDSPELPLQANARGLDGDDDLVLRAARRRRAIVADDLATLVGPTALGVLQRELGTPVASALAVPLLSSDGEVLGVLQLFNAPQEADGSPVDPKVVEFMEALCAQAAVAMENQKLLRAQRELMDAIIQMLASAIDAKSAYTGATAHACPNWP